MGLDLALGGLVLLLAIRGYFKGFLLQAIRLVGLIACVFAADPVRDVARPQVLPYLPKIHPELIDRGLWWSAAVLSYVVLVGLGTLAVKLSRRQPYGMDEANRNDQLAGSMLGFAKGLVVAAFLAMGIEKYAIGTLKGMPWAEEQAKESTALFWNERYHPAVRIWTAPPVRLFVNRVKRRGLNGAAESREEPAPVQTASRTPRLQWLSPDAPPPRSEAIDPEVARAVEAIKDELRKVGPTN